MEPRRLVLLPSFRAALQRLAPEQQDATREAVGHFRNRTNENALQVERKSGLKGIWSFRVDVGIRAFFVQGKDEAGRTVNRLFHVGHHDDYRTVGRKRPR
jgi:mRNA-degrading endonuclease RelE of RelBE toxin-antitoxin system